MAGSEQKKHVIKIDGADSGDKPYGQDGAFHIASITYTNNKSKTDGFSSYRQPEYPTFDANCYNNKNSDTTEKLLNELCNAATDQKPNKIELITMTNKNPDDGKFESNKWYRHTTQESTDAIIHEISDGCYQIESNTTTVGTRKNASHKTPYDFKNVAAA